MAAERNLALGSLVKVDATGGGSFSLVGLTRQVTPPPRERERIDGTVLSDELQVDLLGQEAKSDFTFTQLWHPGDTDHEKIDTLFDSKDEVDWQIIYPPSVNITDTFAGRVAAIAPEALEASGVISRQVTVHRTGAIAREPTTT